MSRPDGLRSSDDASDNVEGFGGSTPPSGGGTSDKRGAEAVSGGRSPHPATSEGDARVKRNPPGCAHGIGRAKCPHCAPRCPVCGYRVDVVAGMWGWLTWRQKQYRWPRRKRVSQRCPECGTFVILVHELSRDVLESA